jgi:hypothetical protein
MPDEPLCKSESNIEFIPDEFEDYYSEDNPYEILSWGADLSFRELISMYEAGELVKPDIQRNYVWDKLEASRFIESILLGLPIPSILLAKKGDKKLIVDGLQRILTIYDFVKKGIFSDDGSVFNLSNTEKINELWRNKTFGQLNEAEQRRILSTTIHAIIFMDKKMDKSNSILYQVFERINSSGRTLTPQEIRNCIYSGNFNKLIHNLNLLPSWRKLYGEERADSRMTDIEFILRFFAISDQKLLSKSIKQISLKKELNLFMDKQSKLEDAEGLNRLSNNFVKVMDFIYSSFGDKAFKGIARNREGIIKDGDVLSNKFFPTIFDSISIATLIALNRNPTLTIIDAESKRLNLLRNKDFDTYSTIRTTNISHILGRISLALKYLYGMDYE